MDPSKKRYLQIFLVFAIVAVGGRTLWIFHERRTETVTEKPAPKERNEDDYVYLRPSHAHDLASARAVLKGNTVWVKAGNAVAYFQAFEVGEKEAGVLPPLAKLKPTGVVMHGQQMYVEFGFDPDDSASPTTAPCGIKGKKIACAAPIGTVRNGDATIVIDDLFFLSDPHTLYKHWSKDAWSAVERHEITKGMSEMQAQAAMGLGRAPESGADGDYGNRTLVFTDPAHPDKPVTVHFVDNAAVSVSK